MTEKESAYCFTVEVVLPVIWAIHNVLSSEIGIAAYVVIPSKVEESERARPFDCAQGDMVGGHSNAQGDTAAASEAMLYLALPSWKMKSTETNFTEGIDRGGV